jgi:hypothetical protein
LEFVFEALRLFPDDKGEGEGVAVPLQGVLANKNKERKVFLLPTPLDSQRLVLEVLHASDTARDNPSSYPPTLTATHKKRSENFLFLMINFIYNSLAYVFLSRSDAFRQF